MLAYVFWHRPVATTSRVAYEADLVAFHRALAGARPSGLLGSTTLRVDGAAWVAGAGPCYEDWYALASSAALDDLNETAVGEACADAHRAVAAQVDHSAGGLYGLRAGSAAVDAGHAVWFAKPRGMPYQELDATLAPTVAAPGAGLWRRQLVLGPTEEWCLLGPGRLDPGLPGPTTEVVRRLVWTG